MVASHERCVFLSRPQSITHQRGDRGEGEDERMRGWEEGRGRGRKCNVRNVGG